VRAEGQGKPITFLLTPGQQHEITQAEQLLCQGAVRRPKGRPRVRPKRLVGDKGYSFPVYRRFLPFAIYSQTDSPQEFQSNEKYHETKLFSCHRDHQGLHIRHEYPHPPSARLALNRSGKDDFKFSLAANSAINFILS
jgi:hypothetical protein